MKNQEEELIIGSTASFASRGSLRLRTHRVALFCKFVGGLKLFSPIALGNWSNGCLQGAARGLGIELPASQQSKEALQALTSKLAMFGTELGAPIEMYHTAWGRSQPGSHIRSRDSSPTFLAPWKSKTWIYGAGFAIEIS